MKNRQAIYFLFAANSISGFAQGITMISIPWHFNNVLNMPSEFGTITMIITFLSLLWGLYAGTLIDRYNRKHVFLATCASGFLVLGSISLCEPTGVVSVIAPEENSLVGLVSTIIPAITGGNTCIVLASESLPLCAVTFAEVLHSSDVPAGVVNLLTGSRRELLTHFSSHMDVNAVIYSGEDKKEIKTVQENATLNVKRVITRKNAEWMNESFQNPYFILDTQETKTTWHPVGI